MVGGTSEYYESSENRGKKRKKKLQKILGQKEKNKCSLVSGCGPQMHSTV